MEINFKLPEETGIKTMWHFKTADVLVDNVDTHPASNYMLRDTERFLPSPRNDFTIFTVFPDK